MTALTTRKLNLGCGEFHREGFLNVDYYAVSEPDLRHDLEQLPYPFGDDAFDEVHCSHVLEHLGDPFAVMREIHRITAPGGRVEIRVPHFTRAMTHPEHKRGFDVTLPYYFEPSFPGGYQGVHFSLEHMALHWFAQPELKKRVLPRSTFVAVSGVGRVLDRLASLSPEACSKVWCYWVGGFDEIEFVFRVVK